MRTDSRSRYLIFAQKVRGLTDLLIQLVEEGNRPQELELPLRELMASLQGPGQQTSVRALRSRGDFGRYENLVTINEVVKSEDKAKLIDELDKVISAENRDERRENALKAIRFFDALESRALYRFNHSAPRRTAAHQ